MQLDATPSRRQVCVDRVWSSPGRLILTDLVFKLIAFIVLTPLVGILFRALITVSGSAVVSDLDLVFLFVSPMGWLIAIAVGGLWLGIVALEQAALLGTIAAASTGIKLGFIAALGFAVNNAWPVLQVTLRIIARVLLVITPFAALSTVVYFVLLTEYDINFYLREKPPEFFVAIVMGAILATAAAGMLVYFFAGWSFALPLVLFEKVDPRRALSLSAARARGHRRKIVYWIAGWAAIMIALAMLANIAVGLVGRFLVPDSTDSLRLLATRVGLTLLLLVIVNLAVNVLTTVTFALTLFTVYRRFAGQGEVPSSPATASHSSVDRWLRRVTPVHVIASGVLGLVIAAGVGLFALTSVRVNDDVAIIAHRGSSYAAPENTLAAFRQAVEDRADWIELDVQETADGEVVVFHDSDFMKLAGNDLKIWNATIGDLQEIDIGSWFLPEWKDERVPTLEEVLDLCKNKIRVNIELKYYGYDRNLEQRVADVVEARGMGSQVEAMSLKIDGVRKMKAICPEWKVGLLMSVAAGNIDQMEADFLAINARFATPALINSAHQSGKKVYVWTVNDASTMSAMVSRGVDGLITDKPALARSVLDQRSVMSAPERLLLEVGRHLGVDAEVEEQ